MMLLFIAFEIVFLEENFLFFSLQGLQRLSAVQELQHLLHTCHLNDVK